jgi:U3 small nucleolar RNA-associated protein 14
VAEQLALGDALRRKAERLRSALGSDSEESDSAATAARDRDGGSDDGGDGGDAASESEAAGPDPLQVPQKGLLALKFMQRGLEKQRADAAAMMQALRDDVATALPAANDEDDGDAGVGAGAVLSGRRRFGPNTARVAGRNTDDDEGRGAEDEEEEDGPRAAVPLAPAAVITAAAASPPPARAFPTATATTRPRARTKARTAGPVTVALASDTPTPAPDPPAPESESATLNVDAAVPMTVAGAAEVTLASAPSSVGLSQRELVAQAFAGDQALVEVRTRRRPLQPSTKAV